MAFTQTNARLILGYSSMAQLGFITLGLFAADDAAAGAQGALLQAVNHGLVVAPMFFVVALLAERSAGSEDIRDMGGIAFRAPVLAGLFLIATLATLAMPGSANFVGEFLILLGAFESKMAFAFIASIGVVLASVYALRMYIRTMHNRTGPAVDLVRDVDRATRSCSCRWCWRSWRSRCTRRRRSTTREPAVKAAMRPVLQAGGAGDRAEVRRDRAVRPGQGLRAAHRLGGDVAARRADRRRRASCCWSGSRARAFVRTPRRAAAHAGRRSARTIGLCDLAVGRERVDRRRRAGDGRPHAAR